MRRTMPRSDRRRRSAPDMCTPRSTGSRRRRRSHSPPERRGRGRAGRRARRRRTGHARRPQQRAARFTTTICRKTELVGDRQRRGVDLDWTGRRPGRLPRRDPACRSADSAPPWILSNSDLRARASGGWRRSPPAASAGDDRDALFDGRTTGRLAGGDATRVARGSRCRAEHRPVASCGCATGSPAVARRRSVRRCSRSRRRTGWRLRPADVHRSGPSVRCGSRCRSRAH